MPIANINHTEIFYTTDGEASLPSLVFSNSLGTDHSMWQAQLDALQRHFHIIRYDTRGHGQSASPVGPYSLAQLGQDVIALLDFLSIEKVCFCGLSMGGVTGQWLGLNVPERLTRLVIANTAAKVGTADGWQTRAKMVRDEGLNSIADTAASRWFSPGFVQDQPQTVANLVEILRRGDATGYANCCEALAEADFRDEVANISVPTLVIAGVHDPVTTVLDGVYLQEKIIGSQLKLISASHISSIEASSEFNLAILNFLR